MTCVPLPVAVGAVLVVGLVRLTVPTALVRRLFGKRIMARSRRHTYNRSPAESSTDVAARSCTTRSASDERIQSGVDDILRTSGLLLQTSPSDGWSRAGDETT